MKDKVPVFAYAELNSRIMPVMRGKLYEIPLGEALRKNGFGKVSGGGTLQQKSGEIKFCGLDIDLFDVERGIPFICKTLNDLGAPKGSKLTYTVGENRLNLPFGMGEGLAVYINGTDLPKDVYKTCDINFVVEEFTHLLGDAGSIQGHWQGPTETALYLYGPSAGDMKERIARFIATYPLCQKVRVEQIA